MIGGCRGDWNENERHQGEGHCLSGISKAWQLMAFIGEER
jgi:hypothetical protein